MSDPVSNSEIEDVLASIRRLVSENAKALKGDRTRDPEAEKLVLTPALRIDESERPETQADVFAVDTDTWNEVSEKVEGAENTGIFSHKEQHPSPVIDGTDGELDPVAADPDATGNDASAEADVTPGSTGADAGNGDSTSSADTGAEPDNSPEAATQSPAYAESAQSDLETDAPAASALEQRIAELETAMDLRPAGEKTGDVAGKEPGQGAENAAPETSVGPDSKAAALEADARSADSITDDTATDAITTEPTETAEPAADTAERQPAEASDAPPRSWIEGLVAAAAAAEAARLTERAKAREGADKDAASDVVAETDEAVDTVADDADTLPEENADSALGESAEETAVDPADLGTFELTEAHAAPPEPDAEAAGSEGEVEAPAAPALGSVPETEDQPESDEIRDIADEDAVEAAETDLSEDAGPETASGAPADEPGEADAEAGPERSWVDRLIAAAATLRDGSEPAKAETADDELIDEAAEDVSVETALDMSADDALAEDADTAVGEPDVEDAGEVEGALEGDEGPKLEPLNLVDPIATDADPEAAVPEWEPVETPEVAETDDADTIVDVDTVLTGPWTAAAVGEKNAQAPVEAIDTAEADDTVEAAETGVIEDAVETGEEVPVGALEWEPVDPPEPVDSLQDSTLESSEADEIEAASEEDDISEAESDQADKDEDLFASDAGSEDIDFQDESEPIFDEEQGEDVALETEASDETDAFVEVDESDELDDDAAAVAAAAEAEADWGDAGMAAAGVAVSAAVHASQAADDEPAASDFAAKAAEVVARDDEAVIDEAMLRELVAQLVRDELQGTVGERITHNVRKLIRREIARALTLQDFEK